MEKGCRQDLADVMTCMHGLNDVMTDETVERLLGLYVSGLMIDAIYPFVFTVWPIHTYIV